MNSHLLQFNSGKLCHCSIDRVLSNISGISNLLFDDLQLMNIKYLEKKGFPVVSSTVSYKDAREGTKKKQSSMLTVTAVTAVTVPRTMNPLLDIKTVGNTLAHYECVTSSELGPSSS